jgi:hypothetical protein
MATVLHFRRAISYIDNHYPFSAAFGNATTREDCVQSAQDVYENLMALSRRQGEQNPVGKLPFDTICLIAHEKDGGVDKAKVKELITLFRPERNGGLTKLDFTKSIDR